MTRRVLFDCRECGFPITVNWEGYCGWINDDPYCWECFLRISADLGRKA